MAQKVEVSLVDDLDGGQAEETVTFALDGAAYEIDLSTKNAEKLRKVVANYVDSARKMSRRGHAVKASRNSGGAATVDREQTQAIREWAKKKGLKVSDRGRISAEIVAQYHAQR